MRSAGSGFGELTKNHIAEATHVWLQLDHAERFGGTTTATTDVMAQQAFGAIDRFLLLGVDYTGDGTADDPFRLGSHLQPHLASQALLTSAGVADVVPTNSPVDRAAWHGKVKARVNVEIKP